ncbi:MAG: hypothetical protein GX111_01625 [Clostridiales bacterium]|nr:hypothetical protein [Clostridiales bacterium]
MKRTNDIFIEELIRRGRGSKESMAKLGAVFLALVLILIAFKFTKIFFPFFFAVICILLFFTFKYTVKEFEYSFINGELDIDAIWGMRKRKTVFSVSCKEIKIMAPVSDDGSELSGEYSLNLDASISKKSKDRWYFICEKADGSRSIVYLNPSERLKNAFKTYLGVRMRGH